MSKKSDLKSEIKFRGRGDELFAMSTAAAAIAAVTGRALDVFVYPVQLRQNAQENMNVHHWNGTGNPWRI